MIGSSFMASFSQLNLIIFIIQYSFLLNMFGLQLRSMENMSSCKPQTKLCIFVDLTNFTVTVLHFCIQVLHVIFFKSLFDIVAVLPSEQVKSMTSHRLIEPTFNLEDKICKKHERLLDVYCRTDHVCICSACAESTHKSHDIVSTDHEWKKKMVRHLSEHQCWS